MLSSADAAQQLLARGEAGTRCSPKNHGGSISRRPLRLACFGSVSSQYIYSLFFGNWSFTLPLSVHSCTLCLETTEVSAPALSCQHTYYRAHIHRHHRPVRLTCQDMTEWKRKAAQTAFIKFMWLSAHQTPRVAAAVRWKRGIPCALACMRPYIFVIAVGNGAGERSNGLSMCILGC